MKKHRNSFVVVTINEFNISNNIKDCNTQEAPDGADFNFCKSFYKQCAPTGAGNTFQNILFVKYAGHPAQTLAFTKRIAPEGHPVYRKIKTREPAPGEPPVKHR